ncbi:mechanosensitive ion channel family protein [[Limnothrix rosea] IAM M-220]|uniref:mechanosensitive ion channel family protein n=1 Tax=[Limnothrix rosea] IAM M-220 TaxID=454133 RepID=UPI000969FBA5|nr:mechanosensitive ion channel family protein [[Limnothrix rosea] IAM M-220]OKH19926.1 mechanosensitive ion channel family protein [[Limnothrix rosea] IAM M-220]
MTLRRSLLACLAFCLGLLITISAQSPVLAGLGVFNVMFPETDLASILPNDGNELIVERCVYLDGRCVFKVAAPRSEMETRLTYIQAQLNRAKRLYRVEADPNVKVWRKVDDSLSNIMITIDDESLRLMTVTRWDAELQSETIPGRTTYIIEQIEASLAGIQDERSPEFLRRQGIVAGIILAVAIALNLYGRNWYKKLKQRQEREETCTQDTTLISTQLTLRQFYNLQEVQYRLCQLLRWGSIMIAVFIVVGLFPQTRIAQVWLLGIFRYPIILAVISITAYIAIRLSYALVAQGNQLFTAGALDAFAFITQESNQRLQLRVNTFSQVARSIITIIILAIALLTFFWVLNINIAPILAGAGIIGLAISFAAQNLLKDIINGFCIIFEDQYAVGDVISVGDVAGFVENVNLRITQLRDEEGRLITIPNSEVKIVANLTNEWSRASLHIPVAYQTDIDQALEVINNTAWTMRKDEFWGALILEDPLLLGVDNFNERGMLVKLWLKTLPLKQWEVAREYRRRLTYAFEAANIRMPTTQNEIWLHPMSHQNSSNNGDRPEQLDLFSEKTK